MIILVVFAPIFSFEGVEAKLFQPMAISIMLAVLAAVIVALIVVPALASFLFIHGVRVRQNKLLSMLERRYHSMLSAVLFRKKTVVGFSVGLLLIALSIVPFLGTEFVPELEEGTINLRVTLAPSASLSTSLAVATKLEKKLMMFPEVTYALSPVGRPDIGGDPEPVNNIEIYIGLKPVSQWETASDRKQLQQLMEAQLAVHPCLPSVIFVYRPPMVRGFA
jgi:heavy metal efflux system protein